MDLNNSNQLSIPNFLSQLPSQNTTCYLCDSMIDLVKVLVVLPGETFHQIKVLCGSCRQQLGHDVKYFDPKP